MEDISKALAFEVKKEIADRYFGFRKIIEEDTGAYLKRIAATALELENQVGFDLIRIYSLLKENSLIQDFFQLTGFKGDFFFDSYINSSPTIRRRLFGSKKIHGLTRWKRYTNLFYDTYQDLYNHILKYHENLAELTEEYEIICEQIKLFYRKNDINMIMQFFRNIDSQSVGSLNLSAQNNRLINHQDLEKKLKILPPIPAEEQLPKILPIPELEKIKPELKKLLKQSFSIQPVFDPKQFSTHPPRS